jgi:RimJ/RimL family protein N-acetyltransferase
LITSGPRACGDGEVRLREVTLADAADLYRWRMEPATRGQFRGTGEVPFAAHEAFLARYFAPENTDRWFVIEAEGTAVGAIALYDLAADGRAAEWGRFVIAPEQRGRGWGRRSLALLIDHARALGVRDLHCEVLAGNAVAAGLYARLGFRATGSYEHEGRSFTCLALRLDPTDGPSEKES